MDCTQCRAESRKGLVMVDMMKPETGEVVSARRPHIACGRDARSTFRLSAGSLCHVIADASRDGCFPSLFRARSRRLWSGAARFGRIAGGAA
jgi:hypothetical protein